MFLNQNNNYRLILLATGVFVLVLGIFIFFAPPGIFPDPSWGFLVMRSMERGAGFNMLVSPDQDNIALNHSDFLSWWSPGQYLLPYFFKSFLKVNTGKAVVFTITICNLLGLAGFYRLFKKLGFSQMTAAISVAFVASQQFFILPYVFYPGGEVLLFAFGGWFFYGCLRFEKIDWQCLVFVFFTGIIGFVCKSSFLWMFASGLAFVWINIALKNASASIVAWLRNGIILGLPFITSIGVIYVCYLSKGENPSSDAARWLIRPETFTFPMASPLLAGLSIDELCKGLIYHPDGAVLSYPLTIVLLVVLAAASLAFIYTIRKLAPGKNYGLLLVVLYAVSNLFFIYLYLKQSAISYEGRHYRIIGLIAIPGFIYLLNRTKVSRIIFALVWIAFLCWEMSYFYNGYRFNKTSPRMASGIAQGQYDKPTLDELARLDQSHHGDAVFVVMCPDIAVEFVNNRVITLDVDDTPQEDMDKINFAGKAGTIYILMPENYIKSGTATQICRFFTGYKSFTAKQLTRSFSLYTALN